MTERLLYNVKEAAQMLGICRAQLYKEVAAGNIIMLKAGRRSLFPRGELERWAAALPHKS